MNAFFFFFVNSSLLLFIDPTIAHAAGWKSYEAISSCAIRILAHHEGARFFTAFIIMEKQALRIALWENTIS